VEYSAAQTPIGSRLVAVVQSPSGLQGWGELGPWRELRKLRIRSQTMKPTPPFNSMTVFDCLLWRFAPDNPTGVRWETIGAILKNSLISALDC